MNNIVLHTDNNKKGTPNIFLLPPVAKRRPMSMTTSTASRIEMASAANSLSTVLTSARNKQLSAMEQLSRITVAEAALRNYKQQQNEQEEMLQKQQQHRHLLQLLQEQQQHQRHRQHLQNQQKKLHNELQQRQRLLTTAPTQVKVKAPLSSDLAQRLLWLELRNQSLEQQLLSKSIEVEKLKNLFLAEQRVGTSVLKSEAAQKQRLSILKDTIEAQREEIAKLRFQLQFAATTAAAAVVTRQNAATASISGASGIAAANASALAATGLASQPMGGYCPVCRTVDHSLVNCGILRMHGYHVNLVAPEDQTNHPVATSRNKIDGILQQAVLVDSLADLQQRIAVPSPLLNHYLGGQLITEEQKSTAIPPRRDYNSHEQQSEKVIDILDSETESDGNGKGDDYENGDKNGAASDSVVDDDNGDAKPRATSPKENGDESDLEDNEENKEADAYSKSDEGDEEESHAAAKADVATSADLLLFQESTTELAEINRDRGRKDRPIAIDLRLDASGEESDAPEYSQGFSTTQTGAIKLQDCMQDGGESPSSRQGQSEENRTGRHSTVPHCSGILGDFICKEIAETDDDEIKIVGETGKNALSDFAHPRYDCVAKPFDKNPTAFCSNCYCYVCDVKVSECESWIIEGDQESDTGNNTTARSDSHCFAHRRVPSWKKRRGRLIAKRLRPERALKEIAIFLPDTVPTSLPRKRRTRGIMRYGQDEGYNTRGQGKDETNVGSGSQGNTKSIGLGGYCSSDRNSSGKRKKDPPRDRHLRSSRKRNHR